MTENWSPAMMGTLVTAPQPGVDKLLMDSKTLSAKLVDHVMFSDAGPTRAISNHGTGTIAIFVIVMYQRCPPAQ